MTMMNYRLSLTLGMMCVLTGVAHAQSPVPKLLSPPISADAQTETQTFVETASSIGKKCGDALADAIARATKQQMKPIRTPDPSSIRMLPKFDKTDTEVIEKMTMIAFDAARNEDVSTINAYLREGFSANVRSKANDTLLSVAAYNGSSRVVARLLKDKSIDVNAPGRMGLTALAAASFKGEVEILKILLASGANAEAANAQGQTALMFAALTGRAECVRLLLDAGADPSRQDAVGNSAASLAMRQGATEVISQLHPEQAILGVADEE